MQKTPEVFTPNSTQRVSLTFPEKGRTKQSHKDECNINTIMERFQRTGMIDFVNEHKPQYGDVSDIDFQGALDDVRTAQALFAGLPSSVRSRFNNDPGEYLNFAEDPTNRAEALALGLISKDAQRQSAPKRTRRKADSVEPKAKTKAVPASPDS